MESEMENILATKNFVRARLINNSYRIFWRDYLLYWQKIKVRRVCMDCGRNIRPGEQMAFANPSYGYCAECVALMSEEEAFRRSDKRESDLSEHETSMPEGEEK